MIYIYAFLSSTFFAYLASRSKNRILIFIWSAISILIPSILGGLRAYGVGTDTKVYGFPDAMAALRSPDLYSFLQTRNMRESGYAILCYAVMKTLGHENWCYFAYQLLIVSCTYIGAYRHKDKISLPFTMLVWYLMFYNLTYNAIRQAMAISIIFMEMDKLETKQYLKFSIAVLIASLFHYSAYIAFVMLLGAHIVVMSKNVQKNLWLKSIVLYGALLSAVFARPIIGLLINTVPAISKYSYALTSAKFSETAAQNTLVVIMLGELLMFLLYRKKADQVFLHTSGIGNIEFYQFNILVCVVFQLAIRFFVGRVLLYSEFINIIAIAAIPNFVKEKHLRFMVAMVVLAVMTYYWVRMYAVLHLHETWPYKAII